LNDGPESVPGGHPLSGVLDRLLARERGTAVAPVLRPLHERPLRVTATESRSVLDPAKRRMLVVAGLGPDGGDAARKALARWALLRGRHPAALDIGCTDCVEPGADDGSPASERSSIPLISLPSSPERLRDEPPEILASLLERLRRHESSADLLVVRIAPRYHMALMRAAFLAGGLVVPVTNSYELLYQAFQLAREALESFLDLTLWPHSSNPVALTRFRAMVREVLTEEIAPFGEDTEGSAGALDRLAAPPEPGFLVSLIDPDTPGPPAELLKVGSLAL